MTPAAAAVRPRLAEDEVQVWFADLRNAPPGGGQWRALLSPEERARADRFHAPLHRGRFEAARGVLRLLISGYVDRSPEELRFEVGERGKPRLLPAVGESPLQFNLSHSGDLAAYAFTRLGEVGIDLEQIRPEGLREGVAERFFSGPERAWLKAQPADRREEAFFTIWTAKEALLKASGAGLSGPPDQVETLAGADVCLGGKRWRLERLEAPRGFVAALALPPLPFRLRTASWGAREGIQ